MGGIAEQRGVIGKTGKEGARLESMRDRAGGKEKRQRGENGVSKEAMEQSAQEGCQTFDMALYDLYTSGKIDLDQALSNADSVNNLRLKVKVDHAKDAGVAKKPEPNGLRLEGQAPVRRIGK